MYFAAKTEAGIEGGAKIMSSSLALAKATVTLALQLSVRE